MNKRRFTINEETNKFGIGGFYGDLFDHLWNYISRGNRVILALHRSTMKMKPYRFMTKARVKNEKENFKRIGNCFNDILPIWLQLEQQSKRH